MHPLRKQRLQLVILIVVAATVVVGLILYMLRENGNFFYTPAEIISGEAPQNVYLRAGGMVVDGSLQRADDSLWVRFEISDGIETLAVEHTGILPDLFAEGEAAIASGKVDENLVLQATQILAKHDENYTPPEVADAMNEAHKRKQETLGQDSYQESEKESTGENHYYRDLKE
jgi:cytochrome c-type biogenesis protein CcmE